MGCVTGILIYSGGVMSCKYGTVGEQTAAVILTIVAGSFRRWSRRLSRCSPACSAARCRCPGRRCLLHCRRHFPFRRRLHCHCRRQSPPVIPRLSTAAPRPLRHGYNYVYRANTNNSLERINSTSETNESFELTRLQLFTRVT